MDGIDIEIRRPFGCVLTARDSSPELRELPPRRLRELAAEHRIVVLRGFPRFDKAGIEDYCSSWGELLRWNFGAVLELVEHEDPKNYIFSNGSVPFHWDGAFAEAVPNFQFFQCLEATPAGCGGDTLFCDTIGIWRGASPEQRARWSEIRVTYITEKLAHYGGEIVSPLVARHPVLDCTTLRFNEPPNAGTAPLNVPELRVSGVDPDQVASFLREMQSLLYDPRYCYAHAWQEGDILIADNHALLHGRNAFRPSSPRRLLRVHIL